MLCHYAPLRTSLAYQVLGRVDDRCGERRLLESVEVESGASIPIPPAPGPRDVVVADVHGLEPEGLLERLGVLLYKGPYRRVGFDDGSEYRLSPEVAADGLIVSAPAAIDFPAPFGLAPESGSMTLTEDSGLLSSAASLTVDFYAVEVRPEPASAAG
jgi:hypothetical protein